MCLILFAYHMHPTYQLIVAANRDEVYERPTAAAHFWEDDSNILAGRDLEKMGTWMGVTKDGRFSALTNYRKRNNKQEGQRSRGELVADFLQHKGEPINYMRKLEENKNFYPGYNLLAGDINELFYYSNKGNHVLTLEPGIYGLSNHLLNTEWPKVKKGKAGLAEIISQPHENWEEKLFHLLQDTDKAPDELLPDTGFSLEWEKTLSSIFIKSEHYGTRSSTVLLMSDNEIHFIERELSNSTVTNQHYKIPQNN